jgi:hypothetical protein
LFVTVEEGRVRGVVKHAIDFPIPKWNVDADAYVMPDGSTVQVKGDKLLTVTPPLTASAQPVPETFHTTVLPPEARR